MKVILVPTDFSVNAYKAFQYALEVSVRCEATIILLNVCQLLESPFVDRQALRAAYNQALVEELTAELEVWAAKANEKYRSCSIVTRLYKGPVEKSIFLCSEENSVDLIIMGTQGASGLKEVIIGSTTASIICKSTVPVLAVPATYQWKEPRTVLFCAKELEIKPEVMRPVFDITGLFSASLHLCMFNDLDKVGVNEYLEHERVLDVYQKGFQRKYNHPLASVIHLEGMEFETTLEAYVNKLGVDLLVMSTHKHGLTDRLFRKSHTRKMAFHTRIPLLAIPG